MPLTRALRAMGADLPFGDLVGAHPGVALESFFWRVVDPARERVTLAICTLCRGEDGRRWASVAVARDRPAHVAETIVDDVDAATDRLGLRAGDVLHADDRRLRLDLGPGLDVELAPGGRWPRGRHGGLGLAHLIPGLTQYWHPHLLGARVLGGEHDGALVYGEKNWGRGGAPRSWWWGQAFAGRDVAVAFAGGLLDAGPLGIPATALALRAGDELAAFSPPFGVVRVDARAGGFTVAARSAAWTVRLEGEVTGAPLDLPVPVPGERRTLPLSHQHQHATVEIVARRGRRLVVDERATLGGFERGGAEGTGAAA